jgi:hypothetical protein
VGQAQNQNETNIEQSQALWETQIQQSFCRFGRNVTKKLWHGVRELPFETISFRKIFEKF